jgi:hypothetical protein
MLQRHFRSSVFPDVLEQITLAPDIVALAIQILAWRLAFLCPQLLLLLLDPTSLEMAYTRIVSRFMRDGAAMRTLPSGG